MSLNIEVWQRDATTKRAVFTAKMQQDESR